MLFNSIPFLFFYAVVTLLYFVLPFKFRWLLLLLASCYFYMDFVPVYILILAFTIVIDYLAGIYIENAHGTKRKLYLIISLCSNIGILVFFKYFNFVNDNITALLLHFNYHNLIHGLSIILPIGLSFHTFQAMSYTIEVYRGNQKAERHFGIYSLYVMFYPQLVAGPIERPQNILQQFHQKRNFDYKKITGGLKLMAWGLFKKIVIADRLAIVVNAVYDHPKNESPLNLVIATFFFAFQIYCDFSGYTDIAIGAAKTMGFNLMANFDYPFISKNITEFWRRWHISLSTWFNDYLFTPIMVAKRDWGKLSVVFALMVTFLVSGLWHGAGWNFVIFGALHGIAVCYEFLSRKFRKRMAKATPSIIYNNLSIALTFAFACVSWIFFRETNVTTAFYIIKTIWFGIPQIINLIIHHQLPINNIGVNRTYLFYSFFLILSLTLIQILQRRTNISLKIEGFSVYGRWALYSLLIFTILSMGVFENSQFIYFQF